MFSNNSESSDEKSVSTNLEVIPRRVMLRLFDKGESNPKKIYGLFTPLNEAKPFPLQDLSSAKTIKVPKRIAKNIDQVNDLLNDKGCRRENLTDDLHVKTLRFLLTIDDQLVFGPEGVPSPRNDIPAHAHLAEAKSIWSEECITAGNAYFSDDNKLVGINHKSGDFRPSFDSLQFVFPHFSRFAIPMAKSILVYELDIYGGYVSDYVINSDIFMSSKEDLGLSTRLLQQT